MKSGEAATDLALDATLRAALRRRVLSDTPADQPFSLLREDLHRKVRQRLRNSLLLFVVDASESMGEGTHQRMAAAKGAVLALLTNAYQQRDKIGVIAFRDHEADVLLRPTTSVTLAREKLTRLPTGGATPLADGLKCAWELIRTERIKDPEIQPMLILLSDGEANVPMYPGASISKELDALCRQIRDDHIRTVLIDTKPLSAKEREMRTLAEMLDGTYHHILQMKAGRVVELIQQDLEEDSMSFKML